MTVSKPALALCALVVSFAAHAKSLILGYPPHGSTTATILPCPHNDTCEVTVEVTITESKCAFNVKDFIDRHPERKQQEIVWKLTTTTPNVEVQFGNNNLAVPGIVLGFGASDMDNKKNDKKEHIKKFKKQDFPIVLYDIVAEFKKTGDASWTPCDKKGPAIINRG